MTVSGRAMQLLPAGSLRPPGFAVRGRGPRGPLVVPDRGVTVLRTLVGAANLGPPPRVRLTGRATRRGATASPEAPHEDGPLGPRGGDRVIVASPVRTIG